MARAIQRAWSYRSIVWLSGVRRVGKTTLTQMLPDAAYVNCNLPSTLHALDDLELFLDSQPPEKALVFDEMHRRADPSRLLKIAADEYPHLKIVATGSATLAATRKFRDSLTGRKEAIHLCPVLWSPLSAQPLQRQDQHRARRHQPQAQPNLAVECLRPRAFVAPVLQRVAERPHFAQGTQH